MEKRTKKSIDNVISRAQRLGEIVDEGNIQVFQLFGEALDTRISDLPREKVASRAGEGIDQASSVIIYARCCLGQPWEGNVLV